ncbi:MAG: S8 family serine peptidase [Bdellovibrionaceae bacterium]|nr:S8 family serine peptidase [Pseudobdellovibrionaceae bacterium]
MRKTVLFLLFSWAGLSWGAPRIEPRLHSILLSSTESERILKVMVELPVPRMGPEWRLLNRQGVQLRLMQEARNSQAPILRALTDRSSFVARPKRVKQYWLTNSMMVEASVGTLRVLLSSGGDFVMRFPERFSLIQPYVHGVAGSQPKAFTYGLEKMRLPELLRKDPTADGRGVRVGILDTGIDEDHQELHGKVAAFADFSEREENRPYDDHGHGTHVAGTIAGGAASGTRIGVAPAAKLVIGKIFDEEGSADEDQILAGMQWIADPDGNPSTDDAPHVVSNSWGNHVPGGDPQNRGGCRAVTAWLKLSILPVFAAGNHGPRVQSVSVPAACPGALGIGATDENDEIARFSSRGPVVWSTGTWIQPVLSAPGVKTLSAGLNGRYVTMSGTSMATPHVAGAAALALQAFPQVGAEELGRILIRGAVDLGPVGQDPTFGYGRLDLIKAFGP